MSEIDSIGDEVVLSRLLGRSERTPCGLLVEHTDWAATAAGPVGSWPVTLQAALSTALNSRFPMMVMVGRELTMVYNDGYAAMLGPRHPAAMGRPLAQVWSDVWPTIQPMIDEVWSTQQGNHFMDLELEMTRHGFPEQTFFTFSYSPLIDPDGEVLGLLDTALETTTAVLGARRLELVQRLSNLTAVAHTDLRSACTAVLDVLAGDAADVAHAGLLLLPTASTTPTAAAQRFGLPAHAVAVVEAFLADLDGDARLLAELPTLWPAPDHGDAASTVARTLAVPMVPPASSQPIGALIVQTSPHLPLDDAYRTALRLIAAQVATVLGTVTSQLDERRHALADRAMSEALQRSMLTDPVQPDHLQLATRYLPAAAEAQVGGDWYDAFLCQDGSTWLVVGDVAGHDQSAAATMGQVRNLLRGIAYTQQASPAAVLQSLDRAMTGLDVQGLTSVLAMRVEQTSTGADAGLRRVRWSNAGHPAPLHTRAADKSVTALHSRPERMLGADPHSPRTDHETDLAPGDSLLLYTDGLIERRGRDLDDGEGWLLDTLTTHIELPLEALCDHLLTHVLGHTDDDIALLAVHAHPEDRPRPPQAGPRRLPEALPRTD